MKRREECTIQGIKCETTEQIKFCTKYVGENGLGEAGEDNSEI